MADAHSSLALSLPNRVFGGENENQNGFSAPSVQFGRGGLKGLRRRRGGSHRSISQCRGGIIEIHLIIVPSLALNENCLLGSSILIYASLILSGPHKWTLYRSHLDRNAAKCHIWQRRPVDAVALPWLSLFYPRRSRQLFCVSLLGVASFSQYIFLSILI